MNRSLFGGCLIVLLGCGARTEYFTDLDGQFPGVGGAQSAGGASQVGGWSNVAGAISVAGAPGVGGAPHVAGGPGVAGAPHVAGAGGFGATGGILEACQVIAGNSCQQCLCNTCSTPLVECFSDLGCALILACVQQSGCSGVSCYSAKNCRPVIDQFGGLGGPSMGNVLSLLSCSAGSLGACKCN